MVGIILLIAVILLYLFLVAPRMCGCPDRTPLMGVDYAHRGLFDNAGAAPENSLLAIQKAVEAVYGIEFDVQLSKDDVPVIFHDGTLMRMCGVEGNVWDYTLEELQQFKLLGSEQTIPTLESVLAAVDGKVPLIIEYKLDRVQTKVCELSNRLLENYKGIYCIESFHPLAVMWYRKNRPDVVRGQLCEEFWKLSKERRSLQYRVLGYLLTNVVTRPDFVAFYHGHHQNLSRRLHRLLGGLAVCYTIKNQQDYEEAKKHFSLIIFDSFIPR